MQVEAMTGSKVTELEFGFQLEVLSDLINTYIYVCIWAHLKTQYADIKQDFFFFVF